MAQNLKVTHYNNGDEIPFTNMFPQNSGAYTVYDDDADWSGNPNCPGPCADVYGNLYNWFAVDDERGLCMEGWHVPSDVEFMELEMFLGMSEEEANSYGHRGTDEGSKLAENSDLWDGGQSIPPENADLVNNSEFGTSGFNALPAGYRFWSNGTYGGMGAGVYFWSSSESDWIYAGYRQLYLLHSNVYRYEFFKTFGYSIRCLQD